VFASSDVHAVSRALPFESLSAEYAFYHAIKRKGGTFDPHAGVPLGPMLAAIEKDGQPLESSWPYLKQLPSDLAGYKPPFNPGDLYRRASKHVLATFDTICQSLDKGVPLLVTFMPTMNFHRAQAGSPVRSTADDKASGAAHAVVAVGWGDEQSERIVLVRNSWGPKWADAGHAWLAAGCLRAAGSTQ
jgi:hypothetical protein